MSLEVDREQVLAYRLAEHGLLERGGSALSASEL